MASLYWCPCVEFGSTRVWFPPWVKFSVSRSQSVEAIPVPRTESLVIPSVEPNQGCKITLDCSGVAEAGETTIAALAFIETLWAACKGRTFRLRLWSDRAWLVCALETMSEDYDGRPLRLIDGLKFSIISASAVASTTSQITFGTYASEYPFAAVVGRPTGTAESPGGPVISMEAPRQSFCGQFPGIQEAITVSGQEHVYTVGGSVDSTWRVKALQVTSSTVIGATATVVIASTEGVGGAGSTLEATLPDDAYFGDPANGYFDVTAGDSIYVFIDTAGGAQDVQYILHLEAL